jgi:hypothetical protein
MPGVFTVVAIIGVIVSTIASVTSAVIVIPTPITVVTAPVTLAVAAVRSVALIPVLAAITASAATSGATTTRHHSPAPHAAHRVWLGRGFLHVNLQKHIRCSTSIFNQSPPNKRENPSEKNTRQQYSVAELTNNSIIILFKNVFDFRLSKQSRARRC